MKEYFEKGKSSKKYINIQKKIYIYKFLLLT
jgi:hypothetical protein